MGTRADFYIGNGVTAKWIGSIAFDGYPDGIAPAVLQATMPAGFHAAVRQFFQEHPQRGVSSPDHGWPWPWDDSQLTDYAYCFVTDHVEAFAFGCGPFDPTQPEPEDLPESKAPFPDMKAVQNVTFGPRSGLLVVSLPHDAIPEGRELQ